MFGGGIAATAATAPGTGVDGNAAPGAVVFGATGAAIG
jgi:hypothetical protein